MVSFLTDRYIWIFSRDVWASATAFIRVSHGAGVMSPDQLVF